MSQTSSVIGVQVLVYVAYNEVAGEAYGPYVFRFPKTSEELEAFFRAEAPGEFPGDGPGLWGSNLILDESVCEVRA